MVPEIPKGNLQSNVERFSGFANVYDAYRPEAPEMVTEILTRYLQREPELVMDLGCGTGLSTLIWNRRAARIIGVEPNDDMRSVAAAKLRHFSAGSSDIAFVPGYSNQLNVESESVDIITCSQSFHWMEPVSTLREVHRVLRNGGVFAAYDCDWPPMLSWELEKQYMELYEKCDEILDREMVEESKVVKRNKNEHLQNLQASGAFRYTREFVFHHRELCNAERYVGLALSQGGLQSVLKLGSTELDGDIASFREQTDKYFNGHMKGIILSYRMRLGIK
ncbi:MAG TPA: class I SAM-dependent methyltransferase [Paenibacillus sp.]|jgi:ubiquinone/menaquinone biosynthesis C-methylase UbiE